MGKFLKENWIWILAPIVIVLLAVGALVYFTDDSAVAPFQYALF